MQQIDVNLQLFSKWLWGGYHNQFKEDFPEEKLVEFIDAFAEVNCQLPTAINVFRGSNKI